MIGKIESIIEQRREIIAEGIDPHQFLKKKKKKVTSNLDNSLIIKNEAMRLEKYKRKLQNEIEQMLQYEAQMEEIRKRNDLKMKKLSKREEERQREIELKQSQITSQDLVNAKTYDIEDKKANASILNSLKNE